MAVVGPAGHHTVRSFRRDPARTAAVGAYQIDCTETTTVALPQLSANDTMGAVVGNAALMIGEGTETAPRSSRTVSIVDLSQTGAKIVCKFSGVTAMRTDDERGLIYLVDNGGLQILRKIAAPDLELEMEYAKHVLYNR
jgi:hypothetical protein